MSVLEIRLHNLLFPKHIAKMETKKKKREKISAALRNAVWIRYVGPNKTCADCFCCNSEPIGRGSFICGHVIAETKGGPTNLLNLRPICILCNSSMGTKNMQEFIKENAFDLHPCWKDEAGESKIEKKDETKIEKENETKQEKVDETKIEKVDETKIESKQELIVTKPTIVVKKDRSSYSVYCRKKRALLKSQCSPQQQLIGMIDLNRIFAAEWKAMTELEKKPYVDEWKEQRDKK